MVEPRELPLGRDTTRLFIARTAPVSSSGGGGAVVVLHDITDLRHADQMRRDFVANVSHELRTPLTAIRGYVEAIRDDPDNATSTPRFLDIIWRQTTRMQRLVADLLRLARLDARQEPLERARIDIRHLFESVSTDLAPSALEKGQRIVIKEKIAQLEHQIIGGDAQVKAYRSQLESTRKEIESILPLVDQGLIARPRFLQLERSAAGLEGQAADMLANIAKLRQAIAEQKQQIAQLDNDRMTEVTKDLRDTQAKLLEVIPRLMNAQAVLNRIQIRSPYTGRVVGLNIFSVGGVINRGEKILDVVPDQDSLVVEAQIGVDDISDVHPNARAEVHLTAYKQRIIPIVHGDVIQVSADRLTDPKTGNPYYTAPGEGG